MNERMLDKNKKPSFSDMKLFCGDVGTLFSELNNFIQEKLATNTEIKFPYGNNYGWCIEHRVKKCLVCNVFAESNSFCVMIRLSDKDIRNVYAKVSEYGKKLFDNKYPCGDGGWIHYRVINCEKLQEIERIILTKTVK